MKKCLFKLKFLLAGLLLFAVASCSNDDDGNGGGVEANIVATAQANPDLSSLVAALSKADELPNGDLIGILSGPGPFTVFAPSNAAFSQLFSNLDGYSSLDDFDTDEEKELLATILTYHVVAGVAAQSTDLTDGANVTTVQGGTLTTSLSGGVSVVDATGTPANVTTADVIASNGVIHIINKVLLPQEILDALAEAAADRNIVEIANATSDLSALVSALIEADLATTLEGDGPFTVFAPTNDAFATFLSVNGYASVADVPNEILTQVLLNHVVAGEFASTDLTTGYVSSSSTAGPDNANLSLFINTEGGVTINGVSDVSTPDVFASNGVVHIVDAVIGLPTIVDHATANPAFSSLVDALTDGGNTTFTDLLSSEGPYTVFAPTNDAFAAFTNPNGNALDNILSNHVVSGAAAFSGALSNSYVNTLGVNADDDALSLYINTDAGVTLNGVSDVAVADVVATNGVIHAVDAVIDIPTVVTFALADPTFAPLVTALTEGTPMTDFATVLSGEGPFTVFAPTDTAFQALLDSNAAWDAVTDIDEALLTSVLYHHVVSGNVRSGDLTDGIMPTTLEGDAITINLPGTGGNIADVTDGANNPGIGIIAVDVQAGNGVVHVLNQVMIPDTTN
ncbi:fasciclin domain-containing protein [Robiginitalea sp. SC105]|uniref:fasciclin domain-containing protein n=1 Tax=Robiginitalea sp. SC105 TaxID=2762332 RepID=UPI00163ACEE8|nr:fasciclin domain-containing protein [Robiginitalea sp. SC105]MBC2840167.1 fasciclin domain-containing protein [Robiginitalea sp. SC105]